MVRDRRKFSWEALPDLSSETVNSLFPRSKNMESEGRSQNRRVISLTLVIAIFFRLRFLRQPDPSLCLLSTGTLFDQKARRVIKKYRERIVRTHDAM
jgi:hypothetical protein